MASRVATANIRLSRFVKLASSDGKVTECGAGEQIFGVSQEGSRLAPLSGWDDGYAAIADECCEGKLVAVTEGGYDLAALAESLRATIVALEGLSRRSRVAAEAEASPRGEATLKAVLPHVSDRWKL